MSSRSVARTKHEKPQTNMRKTFVTVLLLCSAAAAFAQGTVQFSNGALSRVSMGPPGGPYVAIALTESFNFGLFHGIGESTSLTFLSTQMGMSSTANEGISANPTDRKTALNTVEIPGATPGETDVWIQVKGWDSSFGTDWVTALQQVTLWVGVSSIRNVGPPRPGYWSRRDHLAGSQRHRSHSKSGLRVYAGALHVHAGWPWCCRADDLPSARWQKGLPLRFVCAK